jgi:hypothetical protein
MKSFSLLILALAGIAASSPFLCTNSTCCFGLAAVGGQNGTIGQLDDGQSRIGGGMSPSKFCMTGTSIKDSQGRGCIVTGMLHVDSLKVLLLMATFCKQSHKLNGNVI